MRVSIKLEDRTMHLLAPDEGRGGDYPVWWLLIDGIDKGWREEGIGVAKRDSHLEHICHRINSLLYGNISSSLVDEMWDEQIKPKIEELYQRYQASQQGG